MTMKGKQGFGREKPKDNETQVRLWLACPRCKTKRSFVINETLYGFIQGKYKNFFISIFCEKCQLETKVTTQWEQPTWRGKPVTQEQYDEIAKQITKNLGYG